MRKLLVALVCFASYSMLAQAFVKSINLDLSKKTDVFQIIENDKKQASLFFCDMRKVRCLRFDENFNVVDSLVAAHPSYTYETSYNDIMGYSRTENNYYTYWPNADKERILAQGFDFNTKKVTDKLFQLKLEKEKAIARITIDNVFYIITAVKNSSILNFYAFRNGTQDKKSIDLTSKRFLDAKDKPTTLWDLISNSTDYEGPFSFQTIDAGTPPSLALSANKRKLYVFGNSLVFSMDTNRKFTQTFTVNFSDYSVTQKVYSQPFFEDRMPTADDNADTFYLNQNSNSFMVQDALVQIKSVDNVIKISAKNIAGEELKAFKVSEFESMHFKNSPIYQENGNVKSLKKLDDSNQFVKKMNGLNTAVSLYKSNDKLYMVLGGVSLPQQNDGVIVGAMMGGLVGGLIGAALSSNYYLVNLNSYKNRNVVYVNCLFDNHFDHLDGEVRKTAFDELRSFSESSTLTNTTAFKINADSYFGGYDTKSKNYSFYKFMD